MMTNNNKDDKNVEDNKDNKALNDIINKDKFINHMIDN